MKLTPEIYEHFKYEEGYKRAAYRDTHGYWTIGNGHFLGADPKYRGLVWTDEQIKAAFEKDFAIAVKDAASVFPGQWESFSPNVKLAITDMVFNLGIGGFKKFKNTIALIAAHKFQQAADNAMKSLWAKQVPNRAQRTTDKLRKG